MTRAPDIPGGYVLFARRYLTMLAAHPAFDLALWVWLLCRANHRDTADGALQRGQLHATLAEISRALGGPGRDAVWRALRRLRRSNRVTTRRTTRGLIVTLVDYARYQDPGRYARDAGTTADRHRPRHDRQEEKNEKKGKGSSPSVFPISKTFEEMDRDRAAGALDQACEEFLADDED